MYLRLFIANICARYSCAKCNRFRSLRLICRKLYLALAEVDVRRLAKMTAKGTMYCLPEDPWRFMQKRECGAGLSPVFNLYAHTIYGADLEFAHWPEEAGTLIGDKSKHVVRHSPSFCALMIRLATGHWPSKQQRHAKEWVEYLAENGFTKTVLHPVQGEPYTFMWPGPKRPPKANFYIGILPNYGEYGLAVWTDGTPTTSMAHVKGKKVRQVLCATYIDGQFRKIELPNAEKYGEVTWVQIV